MAALGKRKTAASRRTSDVLERPEYGWIWKPLLALLVLYLLVTLALGIWWSREPPAFEVDRVVDIQRGDAAADTAAADEQAGAVTTATLMTLVDTLLDKPGGYLRNDFMPPGLWLDNQPNWEYGVLRQVRDMSSSLSTLAAGSPGVVEEATERFQANSRDWLYPSTERRLQQGTDLLGEYLMALGSGDAAGFRHDGEAVSAWLDRVEERLASLTTRLSASVGESGVIHGLDVDNEEMSSQTPWYKVDDYFYEARGSAWALMHLLRAMEQDQAELFEQAGVDELTAGLMTELERTQRRLWSPVVLNGSGFGIFANHSLMMANHTQRARELIAELSQRLADVDVSESGAADSSSTETAGSGTDTSTTDADASDAEEPAVSSGN
ncbi:DUF2333 family protein [Aidingimonas lacisalsi]|uniref:DUF2333 family protein n=1 Tax=Aidingimonas lacisalsi TaxID=2604086 RepID=UPI0011D288EA|nr:DUF2333 family protein [Aidingimonas lacisalsi]